MKVYSPKIHNHYSLKAHQFKVPFPSDFDAMRYIVGFYLFKVTHCLIEDFFFFLFLYWSLVVAKNFITMYARTIMQSDLSMNIPIRAQRGLINMQNYANTFYLGN